MFPKYLRTLHLLLVFSTSIAADSTLESESPASYGESCNKTSKCNFEDGLECSKDKHICECRKTWLLTSGFEALELDEKRNKCVSKLDSYCVYKKPNIESSSGFDRVSMQCAEHTVCDHSIEKCICDSKYYKSEGKCILARSYRESCAEDIHSCSKYENLICEHGICTCAPSTKVHGTTPSKLIYNEEKRKCVKRVGDKCTDGGIECTLNAKCTQDKGCRCEAPFEDRHGICVLTKSFGELCAENENLCSTSKGLVCLSGNCACRNAQSYIFDPIKGKCSRKIGWDCHSSAQCPQGGRCVKPTVVECPKGNVCLSQICKCDLHYYEHDGICILKKPYGSACKENAKECAASLMCIDEICQCVAQTTLETETGNCVLQLGEFCLFPLGSSDTSMKCVQNATCYKGHCHCSKKYNETADGNCLMSSEFICDLQNSVYSDNHAHCVGLVTKPCIGGLCVDGAVCVNEKCVCDPTFFHDHSSHTCHFKKIYNERCNYSSQCIHNEFMDLECRSGICTCKNNTRYSAVRKYDYTWLKEKSGHIYTIAGDFVGPRVTMCASKVGKHCKGYCEDNAVCNAHIIPSKNTVEYTTCLCDKGHIHYSGNCVINSRAAVG